MVKDKKNNKVRLCFEALAEWQNIPLIFGWKSKLVKKIGHLLYIEHSNKIGTWENRNYIPDDTIARILKLDITDSVKTLCKDCEKLPPVSSSASPGSTNGTKNIAQSYKQTPEHMGSPQPLDKFELNDIFSSEEINSFDKAVSGLKEIFESRDPIVIAAVKANIRAFLRTVHRGRKLNQQSKEIEILKDECDELKDRLAAVERWLGASPTQGPQGLKEGAMKKGVI